MDDSMELKALVDARDLGEFYKLQLREGTVSCKNV
jgi:hypothetical protein